MAKQWNTDNQLWTDEPVPAPEVRKAQEIEEMVRKNEQDKEKELLEMFSMLPQNEI